MEDLLINDANIAPRQLLGISIGAGVTALVGAILGLVASILGGTAMIIAAVFVLVFGILLFPAGLLATVAKLISHRGLLPFARLLSNNGTLSGLIALNGTVLTVRGNNLTVQPIESNSVFDF